MENVMKRKLVIVFLGCILLVAGFCVVVGVAQQPGTTEDTAAQITALQKERIEALKKVVSICIAQNQAAGVSFETVAAAQEQLIDAQLDATDKTEERVALLTEQLKVAEGVFNYWEGRHKVGFKVVQTDVLRAKAHALDVKIKLLRERAKLNPAEK
jgi:hypothetical protein